MKDTLAFILSHLVENPDGLSIEETENDGKTVLSITAESTDIGRIIGKHGRIIKAIRDLIKIIAIKQNRYVDVIIAE